MKKFFLLLIMFIPFIIRAQIGVATLTPDTFSVLDIASTRAKGFVLPKMTTAERLSLKNACTSGCPESMLVFDTDKKAIFYFYNATGDWYALNNWVAIDQNANQPEKIYTHPDLVKNLALGTTPSSSYKLAVDGGKTSVSSNLDVTGNSNIGGNLTINNQLTTLGNYAANGGLQTKGEVKTNNFSTLFSGAGPAPRGTIILWSPRPNGSVPPKPIPAGWAVCDGTNGTPDLTDRMIIVSGNTYPHSYVGNDVSGDAGYTDSCIVEWTGNIPHQHDFAKVTGSDGKMVYSFNSWDAGQNSVTLFEHKRDITQNGDGNYLETYFYAPFTGDKTFKSDLGSIDLSDFKNGENYHKHQLNGPYMSYFKAVFIMKL